MPELFCSFRIFGYFKLVDQPEGVLLGVAQSNLIEFFHARIAEDAHYSTFVRFSKLGELAESFPESPQELPKESRNIFDETVAGDLVRDLLEKPEVAFWICRPRSGSHQGGQRLSVLGGMCLDQFDDLDNSRLSGRFPLSPEFSFGDENAFSSLTFGSGDEEARFHLRLELGFPLPGTGRRDAGPAVVIGGVYPTQHPEAGKFTLPDVVLKGPLGDTVMDKRAKRLGTYGLSDQLSGSNPSFLTYGKTANRPDITPYATMLGLKGSQTSFGVVEILSGRVEPGEVPVFAVALTGRFDPAGSVLDLTEQLGGVVPARRLELELFWTTVITDEQIRQALIGRGTALSTRTQIRLRWEDRLPVEQGSISASPPGQNPALNGAGLAEVARLSDLTRAALNATNRQPQSILPELRVKTDGSLAVPLIAYARQFKTVMVLSKPPRLSQDGDIEGLAKPPVHFGISIDSSVPGAFTGGLARNKPLDFDWLYEPHQPEPVALRIRLPGFHDLEQGPAGARDHNHIHLTYDARSAGNSGAYSEVMVRIANDAVAQSIPHGTQPHRSPRRMRLGSIAFTAGKTLLTDDPVDADLPDSSLIIRRRDRAAINLNTPQAPTLDVTWNLSLAIARAEPVTTDIPHGDRDERPDDLLISESDIEAPGSSPFALLVSERLRDDQDRHLTVELREQSSGELKEAAYTVLTQAPMSVYRFVRQPLGDSADDQSGKVALYDSDFGEWQWQNSTASQVYMFTRPPGAVGEDADKPGRLEIHDLMERPKAGSPISPILASAGGVERRHAVDMRLSPPTTLWIEPNDLRRNYALPQYAGRQLFRQRGDFGLGVRLSALRTELLYGISVGVLPAPATAERPTPRVAELQALVGRVTEDATRTDEALSTRWELLRKAMERRPERLEIWTLDPARSNPFVPARFESGLTFALRSTALLSPPVISKNITPGTVTPPSVSPVRFHPAGLAGGALWPIESANVARVIAENPVGSGGVLDKVALSPTGDSGDQTVRFLGDYATIISETREGRLQRHRVEIMGRIGVFWHRAKHVVIYERTTAASAQFAPKNQPSRSSRPILRKVEEFIEILEPSRRYPDMDKASARSRGFLREVRFNSRIIHVNSAWGNDLGTTGWQVPLWNRGEAASRPSVYPYPDVAFATAGEGKDSDAQAVHDCLDVENIYFYTDPVAAKEHGGSDNWPARRGVDFAHLGHPDFLSAQLKKSDEDNSENLEKGRSRHFPAPRIPPALKRYSWRLAPSPTRTRLNEARGAKQIFAGIESVSMMRLLAGMEYEEERNQYKTLDNARTDSTDMDSLSVLPEGATFPRTIESGLPGIPFHDDIRTQLNHILGGEKIQKADVEDLLGIVVDIENGHNQDQLIAELKAGFGLNPDQLIGDIAGLLKNAGELVEDIRRADAEMCDKIAGRAADLVRQRKHLCLQMLRQATSETTAWLRDVEIPSQAAVRLYLKGRIDETTRDLFEQASDNVGDIMGGVTTARAIVADWREDAAVGLRRAHARVKAMRAGYEGDKPWSRNRLDKALASIEREFDAAEHEALSILDETQRRLATEIHSAAQPLSARVTATIARILKTESSLQGGLRGLSASLNTFSGRLYSSIDQLPTKAMLTGYRDKLADKWDEVSNPPELAKDAYEKLSGALDALINGSNDIDTLKVAAKGEIAAAMGAVDNGLDAIGSIVATAGKKIVEDLETIDALIAAVMDAATTLSEEGLTEVSDLIGELFGTIGEIRREFGQLAERYLLSWKNQTDIIDTAVAAIDAAIADQIHRIDRAVDEALRAVDHWLAMFQSELADVQKVFSETIPDQFTSQVVAPVLDAFFQSMDWQSDAERLRSELIEGIGQLSEEFTRTLDSFTSLATGTIDQSKELCARLIGYKDKLFESAEVYFKAAAEDIKRQLQPLIDDLNAAIANASGDTIDLEDFKQARAKAEKLLNSTNEIINQVAEAGDHARSYIDRGTEIIEKFGDASPGEIPGLALNLISAATQAPEIAALRTNADRIRVLFEETRDELRSTKLKGAVDQLGDALKTLGLKFDFSSFSDTFTLDLPDDGSKLLRRFMPDLGAIDFSQMLPSASLPGELRDAIKVTHDLNAKTGRAWVQADVDIDLPGRQTLFTIGPFSIFLTNSILKAFVRAEASKDQAEVALTDQALIKTNIEAVVSGQVMVTLQDVLISYSSSERLDFAIDPKKIRIHQSLRFIQDTLGSIFGDSAGGLKFIKEGGIPVGVEHQFTMPPLSLNYATSGVQNIQIANRFSLRAYPDFVIANRFNLSRAQLPFIFSIFIIGGTGYLQVDADYRPFDDTLIVLVEAGAGGSAALAFSLGPVTGGVFIALSVVLRYQKRIGSGSSADDGLSVSLQLVIAGHVSLWGMVTVYLGILLSISYHESGRVDAFGQLSVEVRISRWFKLKYSTQVRYKLRDGRSSTQVSSSVQTSGKAMDALSKLEKLDKARKSL